MDNQLTDPARVKTLIAELDWCIENGHAGPRTHQAIEHARAVIAALASDTAAIDAAEFAKLQTFLTEHHADVRPSRPAGLAAWALAALVFERAADAGAPSVIAAAEALIEADRAQTLTTEHVNALENAIAIQRGELKMPAAQPDERAATWQDAFSERHQFDVYPDDFMTGLRNEFCAGWQARAASPQSSEKTAKQRYDELDVNADEVDPVERLRAFCSLAMKGQDWLDVEPFFNAIIDRAAAPQSGGKPFAYAPLPEYVQMIDGDKPRSTMTVCRVEGGAYQIPLYARASAPQAALTVEQREALQDAANAIGRLGHWKHAVMLRSILLTQAPTERMSDEAFADKSIACSSCGLTMGESKFLAARKAEIERIDRAGGAA